MIFETPTGAKIWAIGDPHMGKKFERGVPAHRRGEREKSQYAKFVAQLSTPDVDYNICVGDVFDHPHVSSAVVVKVAEAYLKAAELLPETAFIALAGNHDLSRDINVVGAWQLFCKIINDRLPNLLTITEPCQVDEIALLPWQWGVSALDQLGALQDTDAKISFGHWDLQSFGGDDSHMAPTKELHALGVEIIGGGHYHNAGIYNVAGHLVTCTGSMEPYSHAEDPEGDIYVTLTLAEAMDGRDLHNKFVRLELEADELVPEELDCQALTIRRVQAEAQDILPQEDFEWQKILDEALEGLTPEVTGFIKERLTTQ